MTMKLPVILQCDATECAYNAKMQCHAAAITVGNGALPRCDTFWALPDKGRDRQPANDVTLEFPVFSDIF